MANTFYNRSIRKLTVAFGNLFDNITLVRYNPDLTESERFIVPIAYANKELYVQRLEADYDLDKKVQITLPRFSYEMTGFTYDSSRKQNTNIRNFAQTTTGTVGQYNPVPYNFDFNLYLYVRNIEDASQVIEHILSYFTPDYTIKINMIPEMGIVKEVPVVLNSTNQDIKYEGGRDSDTRMIIWTLNFTVKGFIFGPVSQANLITHSITNVYNDITPDDQVIFTMDRATGTGTYRTDEVVYQGYSLATATATAKVIVFGGINLTLTNIKGHFVSSMPIRGASSNSNYAFKSYNFITQKYAQIDVTPNYAILPEDLMNEIAPAENLMTANTASEDLLNETDSLNTNIYSFNTIITEPNN
jgi:hypothetical protein